jgi:hypothetical protein
MDSFDKNFAKAIVSKIRTRLDRDLTELENKAFALQRSGIAYEMIMDFLSDEQKTKYEIEKYVESIIKEIKTTPNIK